MTNSANHLPNFLLSLTIRVIAAILAGVVLLTLVFLIPADAMKANIIESAQTISRESTYPELYSWCTSQLDNYTDCHMLAGAAYQCDDESPLQQALMGYHELSDHNPHVSFVNQYVHNEGTLHTYSYCRYWHGYLLFLKPLLCLKGYYSIRKANLLLQTVLLLALICLMIKKKLHAYVLPLLLSVGLLMPMVLAKSLQFSTCYYMMLLGSSAVVAMKEQLKQKEAFIFLWIGIGVAFFDFLTYPMATIGVPAVLCFVICNGPTFKEDFCRLFKICFSWLFGYGGMWAGKWIVGSLLTDTNMIADALHSVGIRVNAQALAESGTSIIPILMDTISRNWAAFWRTPITRGVVAFVLLLLAVYIWRVLQNQDCLKLIPNIAVLAIIACMPFVWYCVLSNHSQVHFWFTNKALVTFAFAILCMCAKLVEATKLSYKRKE